jgi:hypothetical protein
MKTSARSSGIFNPRVLLALALCSCGALLGMLSLAATPLPELESSPSRKPVEMTRANTSLPADPANFRSTVGSNANRLPPGVPLPLGALNPESVRGQFSVNGQGGPSSCNPTAGFPEFAGMPFRPGTASGANSLGNPAPLSVPQPGAPTPNAFGADSTPLSPGATGTWSIVSSPNPSQFINTLYGVSCVSASDCWAVGYY